MSGGKITEQSRYLKPKSSYGRQLKARGDIRVGYVATNRNVSDITTKVTCPSPVHSVHYTRIMHGVDVDLADLEADMWF